MSREQAIEKWKAHVAGIIATGSAEWRKAMLGPHSSSEEFGAVLMKLAETSTKLIGQLYDSFVPPTTGGKK